MAVATAKVTDRRSLRFASFAELAEEVERLSRAAEHGTLRTTGNWSVGQILQHLGKTMQFSFDGFPFKAALPARLMSKIFKHLMWKGLLNLMFKPGHQLPPSAGAMLPADTVSVTDGAALLLAQIQRVQAGAPMTQPHPFLGSLTQAQWTDIHLCHAAAHLSFIHDEKP
jgi:hypothetical protein